MAATLRHFFGRQSGCKTGSALVSYPFSYLLVVVLVGTLGVSLAGAFTSSTAFAQSTNLLTNGNFETGSFAGWTVDNVRAASDVNTTRNFYIDAPGTTTQPVTNSSAGPFSFNTASNTQPGGGGNFYAVTTSDAPGQSALLQSFTTPTIMSGQALRVTFTFDAFVNDQSGYSNTMSDAGSLDYAVGGLSAPRSNQFARVDLLTSSASNFSTSTSDVLFNVPLNVPINATPNTTPNPYQRYTVDLSPYVQANRTYKVRFAEVDNLSALNLGVDNVGVRAEILPEPSTLSLALPLLTFAPALFLVHSRRRRKTRRDVHA